MTMRQALKTLCFRLLNIIFLYLDILSGAPAFVHVSGGTLLGTVLKTPKGTLSVYLGVPYAWPPTGKQRFHKPLTSFGWSGVQNATQMGKFCLQQSKGVADLLSRGLEMEESCLNLNIYVPGNQGQSKLRLPVLVVIHPGNFQEGAGAQIDGNILALHFNVIVVTFNFRLGVFGFLSVDETLTGNNGLWDQVAALNWVNENIWNFGGDKNNVVLLCDHYTAQLYLIGPSDHFFTRIISHDGYGFQRIDSKDKTPVKEHIKKLCLENDIGAFDFPNCLQNLNASQLLDAHRNSYPWEQRFYPEIDGNFLKDNIDTLISKKMFNSVNYLVIHDNSKNHTGKHHQINNFEKCDIDNLLEIVIESMYSNFTKTHKDSLKQVLRTYYHPISSLTGFSEACMNIMADASWSQALSFIDQYSASQLTFMLIKSTNYKHSEQIQGGILPKCVVDLVNCSEAELELSRMLKGFLYKGYPYGINSGSHMKPYSKITKKFLYLENTSWTEEDESSWPYARQEMIWRELLPWLNEQHEHILPVKETSSYAIKEWGLTEEQLDAVLLSLILVGLFLLVVTVTLLRMLCYVRGKSLTTKTVHSPATTTNSNLARPTTSNGNVDGETSSNGNADVEHVTLTDNSPINNNQRLKTSTRGNYNDDIELESIKESSLET